MVIIGQMLIDYFSVFSPVSTLKVEFIFPMFCFIITACSKKIHVSLENILQRVSDIYSNHL